jgi:hypothetical protein
MSDDQILIHIRINREVHKRAKITSATMDCSLSELIEYSLEHFMKDFSDKLKKFEQEVSHFKIAPERKSQKK